MKIQDIEKFNTLLRDGGHQALIERSGCVRFFYGVSIDDIISIMDVLGYECIKHEEYEELTLCR